MRAWAYTKFGDLSVVKLSDVAEPTIINSNDIIVKVHAAALNPVDNKRRSGYLKLILHQNWPTIVGYDVSGVVISVGPSVTKFRVGDAVFATLPAMRMGSLAERVAAPEDAFALKPTNLSHAQAASLAMASLTALLAFRCGKLATGKKVLITAGAGGVGTAAIQIAKHVYKATEIATTASTKKFELVKSLGATQIIDYTNEKIEDKVQNFDFALDSSSESTRCMDVVRPNGSVISLVDVPNPDLLANRESEGFEFSWFTGFILRMLSYSVRRKARKADIYYELYLVAANGDALDEIRELCEVGTLVPVIDKTFPFEQANEALAYLETGRATGKVVVEVVKE